MGKALYNLILTGGPLDGADLMTNDLETVPGKFPFFLHDTKKWRYVYQARNFPEDTVNNLLHMDFVQIIGKRETPLD